MIFFFGHRPRPGRLAAADERERERGLATLLL
jgi:hypothetical protein